MFIFQRIKEGIKGTKGTFNRLIKKFREKVIDHFIT